MEELYRKKSFIIVQAEEGYRIINLKDKTKFAILNSYEISKAVVSMCINKKIPLTSNIWLINAVIRLTDDKAHKKRVEKYLREKKFEKYVNINKGIK